jgi:hypothetical protein
MMVDPTEAFFDELSRRGYEPLMEKITGTVRFEVGHGRQAACWLVTIGDGDIDVARRSAEADPAVEADPVAAGCVLVADRPLFDGIACGRLNAMAAMLRGAMCVDGDPELLVLVQRLFPAPPRGSARPSAARPWVDGTGRRRS